MPDPGDHGAASPFGKPLEGCIALGAIQARQAHLDQFVYSQGTDGFGYHCVRQAGLAHQDDRAEGVGEALEVATLFFG
jgi:hypothetical protein